jgi:hypothetical protein
VHYTVALISGHGVVVLRLLASASDIGAGVIKMLIFSTSGLLGH